MRYWYAKPSFGWWINFCYAKLYSTTGFALLNRYLLILIIFLFLPQCKHRRNKKMKNNNSVIDMCRYTPGRFVFFKQSLVYELVSDSLAFAVAETSELDDYLPESISEELILCN